LAIVISEETGNISVVSDGKFRLHLDGQKLEQILMEEWDGAPLQKKTEDA
jgi:hypothetical protein